MLGTLPSPSPSAQIDNLIRLVEFSNHYVLNDHILIHVHEVEKFEETCLDLTLHRYSRESNYLQKRLGYHLNNNPDPFFRFVREEIVRAGTIRLVPNIRHEIDFYIGNTPYDTEAKLIKDVLFRGGVFQRLEENGYPSSGLILIMNMLMLFSDHIKSDISIDQNIGVEALKHYPTFVDVLSTTQFDRRPLHPEFEEFRQKFLQEIFQPVKEMNSEILHQPCFLLEALRHCERVDGLFHVLREMRNSPAAEAYRTCNRTRLYGTSVSERREANAEIERNMDARFELGGLKSRIPQWAIPALGLSAAAVGFLFHDFAAYAAAAAPALLTGDYVYKTLVTRRRNIFTEFFTTYANLYDELTRIFDGVLFSREELTEALFNRKQSIEHYVESPSR